MLYLFGLFYFFLYSVFLGFFLFFYYCGGYYFDLNLFSVSSFSIKLSFSFDYLSFGFFGCVSFISGAVFFYSNYYMGGGVDNRRFSYLVLLFVVSMFLLVFSGSFFMTMVGWDGLGLVSFCLVIFYSNSSSLDSGLITVFSNRVGDAFFLIVFLFFLLGGEWTSDFWYGGEYTIAVLFIFLGAITKSAQIPFSAWLPAAMAAPTPVSSLVHSSTLVTAGIYVVIRYHFMFSGVLSGVGTFGLITMLLAGFCACLESDFKKVIAMSTLSQLGLMLFTLSLGAWQLAFLHMVIHAFFKSTLFLSCGFIIHQFAGCQDSRFYGGDVWSVPSFLYFLVSCLSLAGFPFVVGFYSKDLILSSMNLYVGVFYVMVFFVCCILTVVYSVRLVFMGFVGFYKFGCYLSKSSTLDFFSPVYMVFLMCCFSGPLLGWLFTSNHSHFFSGLELLMGVCVVLIGLVSYGVFCVSYKLLFFFGLMGFLRWISMGGVSVWMRHLFYFWGEKNWMELSGGVGVWISLFHLSEKMTFLTKIGFKGLVFLTVLGSFFVLCV